MPSGGRSRLPASVVAAAERRPCSDEDAEPRRRPRPDAEVAGAVRARAPEGLPAGYKLRHNDIARLLRLLLATAPADRGPCAAVQEWDDAELVEMLEDVDRLGGFPVRHDGVDDVVHDCRRLPRLDPDQWVFAHKCMAEELSNGWVHRYATEAEIPWDAWRVSPWFLTEKKELGRQVVKPDGTLGWRFVDNVSFGIRDGTSLNDRAPWPHGHVGVDGEWVKGRWFDGVDFAAQEVMRIKRAFGGVEVSKVDEDAAFRAVSLEASERRHFGRWVLDPSKPIPAHVLAGEQPRPEDCCFLFANRLPFGWRGSVTIYHRISRAVNALFLWAGNPALVEHPVPPAMLSAARYCDDSLLIAAAGWGLAAKQRFFSLLDFCGLTVSEKKDRKEGAVTSAWRIFLGVVIDITNEELRVPEERVADGLVRLRAAIAERYLARKECESLVGILNHAAACIPFARLFLRRCWSALAFQHGPWVRLNRGIKADLQFWLRLLRESNGRAIMHEDIWRSAEEIGLYTDASFSGYAAVYLRPDGSAEYFAGSWEQHGFSAEALKAAGVHISELELLVVALAVDRWASVLPQGKFKLRCDNSASCDALNEGRISDVGMLICLREIFHCAASNGFEAGASHIGTKENVLADAGSRGAWARFFEFALAEFGLAEEDFTRVESSLCVKTMLAKIVAARVNFIAAVSERAARPAPRSRRRRRFG
jgi:hypothetical protein